MESTEQLALDPTTVAANPAHYQRFSNGAQPAFICEHLTWNAGQAVRYLARADTKAEGELSAEQVYLQNLKKALWHIKREIMLKGGDPDEVVVPDPRPSASEIEYSGDDQCFQRYHQDISSLNQWGHAQCGCDSDYIFSSQDALREHLRYCRHHDLPGNYN